MEEKEHWWQVAIGILAYVSMLALTWFVLEYAP
jgi:hypothetical protein